MGKRVISSLLVLALVVSMLAVSKEINSERLAALAEGKQVITIWYADDALTEFVTTNALAYQSETGIHVDTRLVSGIEYLEQINTASIYHGEADANGAAYVQPDVYITTHDNLMRAYLAGLAAAVTDPDAVLNTANYPEVALHAISCNDKMVGYPLSYETAFFLYNKTYMADLASARITEENDFHTGETAQETTDATGEQNASDENGANRDASGDGAADEEEGADEDPMGDEEVITSPEVRRRLATMIPATLEDIKAFAYNYEAPDQVEAVFKWDVSDIFYNYFFVGNYMNVGGENGDNNAIFNIFNVQAVNCLLAYQNMNNFFSIDAKEVTYDSILRDFIDGKIVFTVATTDALSKIENAKREGDFNYDYGVAVLPDVGKYLKSRGLSVTTVAAVNGYSEQKEIANDFASFLSFDKGNELYRKAGKVSCLNRAEYDNDEVYRVMNEYEKSFPLPKMMETSNFWVQLEITMTRVFNGADPGQSLLDLSNEIGAQIEEITYHIPAQESFGAGGAMMLR